MFTQDEQHLQEGEKVVAEKYDSVHDSDMVESSTVSSRIVGPGIAAKMRLVLFLIYSCFVCVNFSLY